MKADLASLEEVAIAHPDLQITIPIKDLLELLNLIVLADEMRGQYMSSLEDWIATLKAYDEKRANIEGLD